MILRGRPVPDFLGHQVHERSPGLVTVGDGSADDGVQVAVVHSLDVVGDKAFLEHLQPYDTMLPVGWKGAAVRHLQVVILSMSGGHDAGLVFGGRQVDRSVPFLTGIQNEAYVFVFGLGLSGKHVHAQEWWRGGLARSLLFLSVFGVCSQRKL